MATACVLAAVVACGPPPIERIVPARIKHTPIPKITPVAKITRVPRTPRPSSLEEGQRVLVPAAVTHPAPAGTGTSVEALIREIFGADAERALRIARCESGLNPKAVSRAGAVGVFQVMPQYHSWRIAKVGGTSLFDARTNVLVAKHIFDSSGWTPWVCR